MRCDNPRGRFACPECRGTIPVDPQIRRALVRHGCVLCGSAIAPEDFALEEARLDVENRVE